MRILLWVLLIFPFRLIAQPGHLDPSFGNAGSVITNVARGDDHILAIAIQKDGKIIAAGDTLNQQGTVSTAMILRYTDNGFLDSTFGLQGVSMIPFDTAMVTIRAVLIQSDGKIIAAGSAGNSTRSGFALLRLDENGKLDPSFGIDGKVLTFFDSVAQLFAIGIQSDGKIVAAGYLGTESHYSFSLVRYTATGKIDSSFGTNGVVIARFHTGLELAAAIMIQPDDKIIAAGQTQLPSSDFELAVARFNLNGSLDSSFATNGQFTGHPEGMYVPASIILQPDNKIILGGNSWISSTMPVSSNDQFAVMRMLPNGALDNSFGSNGIVTTDFSIGNDGCYNLLLQPDGKIVAVGSALTLQTAASRDFALVRYTDNGSLDSSFGYNGLVTTSFFGISHPFGSALDSNHRIVAGGELYAFHSDCIVARYLCGLDAGVIDDRPTELQEILVYPNPVGLTAMVRYTLKNPQELSITLCDLQGKCITPIAAGQKCEAGMHQQEISFSKAIASGSYLLVFTTKAGSRSIRIVK